MVCGNFRESICKEIGLHDVVAERLLKLMQLACGKEGLVAVDIEELLDLGELAERLQMEDVRSEIEDELLEELRVENCLEMIQRSEAGGLELLQKGCYKMLRKEFEVLSHKDGFLKLSEETMGALLEEDVLGAGCEEDVYEAAVRWMSNSDEGIRGEGLLRKIRFGVISNEYLAGLMSSAPLLGRGTLKELLGEAMAKKGGAGIEGMWDGVERLCDKWMVARRMKGRIIGADVLKNPQCIAMDGQKRIVVSDAGLHKIIVFNQDGSVARRFGSEGAGAGQFNRPIGVAVDRQGRIVVADSCNHRIQVLSADGLVARSFGSEGTAVGQFNDPRDVAIDREGHIVVADSWNHRIQVFDAEGSVVRHFGSHGTSIGRFAVAMGVAIDGGGRIVVADWGNSRVQVFNGDGSVALCFGSPGDGPGRFYCPCGVAVDSAGRFVVSDGDKFRVQVFNSDGSFDRFLETGVDDMGEHFIDPYGMAVDGAGRIIVAESGYGHRVQVL